MAGRLEVITGPMYSGKSEELIRRLTREKIAGKSIIVFKPQIDDRYAERAIKSHSGAEIPAIPISDLFHLDELVQSEQVIGIDEVQFFGLDIISSIKNLVLHNRIVIITGLDMTYRQEPWEPVPTLMALADRIDKLSAVCHRCGEDAILTQRLIEGKPAPFEGETIQVGGLESYEARCRSCHERR